MNFITIVAILPEEWPDGLWRGHGTMRQICGCRKTGRHSLLLVVGAPAPDRRIVEGQEDVVDVHQGAGRQARQDAVQQDVDVAARHQDVAGIAGVTDVSTNPFDWGIPGLSFKDFQSAYDNNPVLNRNNTLSFSFGGNSRVVATFPHHTFRISTRNFG